MGEEFKMVLNLSLLEEEFVCKFIKTKDCIAIENWKLKLRYDYSLMC